MEKAHEHIRWQPRLRGDRRSAQALFEEFGSVASVNLIQDKYSGESKGFGFVEMDRQADAKQAIKTPNGRVLDGRSLTVNIARPKGDRNRSRGRR